MYKCDTYNTKIDIQLKNGVYVFTPESATGKTRLCKELTKLEGYGEPVTSYSYSDARKGKVKLEDILSNKKYKVIMVDRYDLFEDSKYDEYFNSRIKDCIVLVDYKGNNFICDEEEACLIDMTHNRIEVHE